MENTREKTIRKLDKNIEEQRESIYRRIKEIRTQLKAEAEKEVKRLKMGMWNLHTEKRRVYEKFGICPLAFYENKGVCPWQCSGIDDYCYHDGTDQKCVDRTKWENCGTCELVLHQVRQQWEERKLNEGL